MTPANPNAMVPFTVGVGVLITSEINEITPSIITRKPASNFMTLFMDLLVDLLSFLLELLVEDGFYQFPTFHMLTFSYRTVVRISSAKLITEIVDRLADEELSPFCYLIQ